MWQTAGAARYLAGPDALRAVAAPSATTLRAFREARAAHLRDGLRRERLGLDACEGVFYGTPVALDSCRSSFRQGHGGMLFCRCASSAMNSGRSRSGASRAPVQLGEFRPELFECQAQAARPVGGWTFSRKPWRAKTRPIVATRPSSARVAPRAAAGDEPSATKNDAAARGVRDAVGTLASRKSVAVAHAGVQKSTMRSCRCPLPRARSPQPDGVVGSRATGRAPLEAVGRVARDVTARPLGSGTARILLTATCAILPARRRVHSASAAAPLTIEAVNDGLCLLRGDRASPGAARRQLLGARARRGAPGADRAHRPARQRDRHAHARTARSRQPTRPTGGARAATTCRRCTACRSRTRICRTPPACARPTARPPTATTCRTPTPCRSSGCAGRARSSSARRTRPSGARARTRSTGSSARPATRGTRRARRAARAVAPQSRWPAACCRSPTASDLGGSLRNPAAWSGVLGLRPTPGLVPRWPVSAPWLPFAVEGPMARTAGDLALLLGVWPVVIRATRSRSAPRTSTSPRRSRPTCAAGAWPGARPSAACRSSPPCAPRSRRPFRCSARSVST